MIGERIRACCSRAILDLYGKEVEAGSIGLEKTKREIEGDLTVLVFPLTRYSGRPPEVTAQELGGYLVGCLPELHQFHVVKGFLNLILSDAFWVDFLTRELSSEEFGSFPVRTDPPVILEYSSPNTNKPLHLGHIRNNLLGYSLSLILEANGWDVKKVNLVNDRGIHICKSMVAYLKWGQGETPGNAGIKGDHLVGKYYVLFERHYKEEILTLMESGMTEEEAARSADLIGEAQELLRLWEAGDQDTVRLWKTMNGWAYNGFDGTYKRLGVKFDRIYYESDTYLLGKELVYQGLDEGVLFRKADGSVWIDLTEEGLDEKLLMRSDGTSVYMTQDLGTAEQRYEEYHPSRMIYVVGNEQLYHFEVLKRILRKLGKPVAGTIYHLSYGMVELPEGRMKSREGTVVDADDLMDEMYRTAEMTTRELGKVDQFPDEEAARLFEIIGMGALNYFILKVDPKKNMLFDPKESIDFNGNTGPFIQYTYARIQSLIKKASVAGYEIRDTAYWMEDTAAGHSAPGSRIPHHFSSFVLHSSPLLLREREILRILYQFPSVVHQAGEELSPALIANYIYDLAREYNQFYQEIPVLRDTHREAARFRLQMSHAVGFVIKRGMGLMGIRVPDRM